MHAGLSCYFGKIDSRLYLKSKKNNIEIIVCTVNIKVDIIMKSFSYCSRLQNGDGCRLSADCWGLSSETREGGGIHNSA